MMSTTTGTMVHKTKMTSFPTFNWNEINEPGCYVFVDSGYLARVPFDGVAEGRSPRITFCAGTNLQVCKLSDDPYIPISKARQLAADHDVVVNF
jgi:hypothetical protein